MREDRQRSTIELPKTIADCHEMIKRMAERIAWLEQRYFGSKKDRAKAYDGPSLFDEEFKEAELARKQALAEAEKEVEATAAKRRAAARQVKKANRPEKYQYYGLREETRVVLPEGVNTDDYEVIGHDYTRLLHYRQAELWVECIDRPVLRMKSDMNWGRAIFMPAKKRMTGSRLMSLTSVSATLMRRTTGATAASMTAPATTGGT